MPMAGVSFNEKIDPDLYSLSYVCVDILCDIHCSHATVWVICWENGSATQGVLCSDLWSQG